MTTIYNHKISTMIKLSKLLLSWDRSNLIKIKLHNLYHKDPLIWAVESGILDSSAMDLGMAKENKYGKIILFTKDIGFKIELTEEEDSFMQMEMCTRVSGKTTKLMEKGCTQKTTVQVIQDNGLRIYNMDLELRNGLITLLIRGNLLIK